MKSNKKLKPRTDEHSEGKIRISTQSSQNSSLLEHPIFCFRYLSQEKEYSLSSCQKEQKAAFADTISKLSLLTWQQINSSGRHGSGYEKISKDSMKPSIPSHITDDINLIAFRFCGMAPMIGYKEDAIFRVIWLDKGFKAYKH